jgi:hypothetical protein
MCSIKGEGCFKEIDNKVLVIDNKVLIFDNKSFDFDNKGVGAPGWRRIFA